MDEVDQQDNGAAEEEQGQQYQTALNELLGWLGATLHPPIMGKLILIRFKDTKTQQDLGMFIHLESLWEVYRSMYSITPAQIRVLATVGSSVLKTFNLPQIESHIIASRMADLIIAIIDIFPSSIKPKDLNEQLVHFTYPLLTHEKITYAEAADFAKAVLNTPINADAWRMRTQRWTKRHGLPLPKPKRGRPTSDKPNGCAS